MRQKQLNLVILLFLLVLSLSACSNERINDIKAGVIENQTFNKTLLIDGHQYDGTVIKNCIFENIKGDGLQIRNVNNLRIENCIFRNISKDAIRLRSTGESKNVEIINNQIYNIKRNGIMAFEKHHSAIIKGNIIHDVALSNLASKIGQPHHGIYSQGQNALITENTIYNIINDNGNCVSIRSSGEVSKNILYGATKNGITYYSDHPANAEKLLIENNVIYGNQKRGIAFSSNGNETYFISHATVRFNTIIADNKAPIGIDDDLKTVTFDVKANILIRTDKKPTYIYTDLKYNASHNITENGDIGFVDYLNRDLRLDKTSKAINSAVGIKAFPKTDILGTKRNKKTLVAGAYAVEPN